MGDARTIVRENRRPIADFAATGLYEFSLFLTDMRKFVRTFDRIMTRIESDPSQFLFGNRQRGFETQGNR
jgi:phospholipid/cholesterol/gamma-HCH transport system substrate-binding protein